MSGASQERALARVDAFAADMVRRAAPLRLGIGQTLEDQQAVYQLRYRVVIDQGWGKPEDFPDQQERDEFDDHAIQVVAWSGSRVVGTTRLVLPHADRPLPTEKVFGLNLSSRAGVIDMGRTCRAPDFPDAQKAILWGILGQAWIEARRRGFSELCGMFNGAVLRLYRRLGLHAQILGEPRPHWSETRYPVLVRPAESIYGKESGNCQVS